MNYHKKSNIINLHLVPLNALAIMNFRGGLRGIKSCTNCWPNICCSSSLRRSGSPCSQMDRYKMLQAAVVNLSKSDTVLIIYIYIYYIYTYTYNVTSYTYVPSPLQSSHMSPRMQNLVASVPHTTSRRVLAGAHHGDLDGLGSSEGLSERNETWIPGYLSEWHNF